MGLGGSSVVGGAGPRAPHRCPRNECRCGLSAVARAPVARAPAVRTDVSSTSLEDRPAPHSAPTPLCAGAGSSRVP